MARPILPQYSFSNGEITPRLRGRSDLDFYKSSCSELTNFTIFPHGGISKRTGTDYIATAKDNYKVRLIKFKYSTEQTYVIEMADEVFRFYKDGGVILASGIPYEIETPFGIDDVYGVKFAQTADTMYMVHPDYPPQKLTREGHTDWTIEEIDFEGGPYLDMNTTAVQITPSAATGTIALTASSDVWNANHVGALWKFNADNIEAASVTAQNQWTDSITTEAGDTLIIGIGGSGYVATVTLQKSYDGGSTWIDYYQVSSNETTEYNIIEDEVVFRLGVKTGDFTSGTVSCTLTQRDQWGEVEITGYNSTTSVSGIVNRTLPSIGAYTKWSEGAWSPYRGYPSAVVFSKQRSIFAGTTYQPQTFWGSKIDDYTNFDIGENLDDDAFNFTIVSKDVNNIHTLYDSTVLIGMTTGGEWKLSGSDITPTSPAVDQQATYGVADVQGVQVGNKVIYVQNGQAKIRAFGYRYDQESWVSDEISMKAEHMFRSSAVTYMDFAAKPDSNVFFVMDDGKMSVLTYEPVNSVVAYSQHETEGEFESVAVLPGNSYDEVWVSVKRTIDGNDVRYIERFTTPFWEDTDEYTYTDSTITYTGAPKTTLSGATHLANTLCHVTVDGAVHAPVTVTSGGVIELQQYYQGTGDSVTVRVGLPYTATFRSNRLAPANERGSSIGKRQVINKFYLDVMDSINAKVGTNDDNLQHIKGFYYPTMTTPPEPYTGTLKMTPPTGFHTEQYIQITSDTPTPLTILSWTADMTASSA